MSKVRFISDLHLGHENILKFSRPEFHTIEEHDNFLIDQWANTVAMKDLVFVLGDVSWTEEGLERMIWLPGRKFLVRGNHDVFSVHRYLLVFEDIIGLGKWKGDGYHAWLSHAPVHPEELRGRLNIHGHVHRNSIKDTRYINVCAEMIGYAPRTIKELAAGISNES